MEQILNLTGTLLLTDLSPEVQTLLGLDGLSIENPYTKVQRGLLIREELIERTRPKREEPIGNTVETGNQISNRDLKTDHDPPVLIDPPNNEINPEEIEDDEEEDEENDETMLRIFRTPADGNSFYLCTSPQAADESMRIIKRLEASVRSQITRYTRKIWKPEPATLDFIDAEEPILQRGLIKVELLTKYPRYDRITLTLNLAREENRNGCYTELVTTEKYRRAIVHQRRVCVAVQAKPIEDEAGTQTALCYPETTWTQYEFAYPEVKSPTEEFAEYFSDKLKEMKVLDEALLHNSYLNFYSLDYYSGVLPYSVNQKLEYEVEVIFKDVVRCKDKVVSAFVVMEDGYVAASYGDQSWRASTRQNVLKCAVDLNFVLVWSQHEPLHPKLLLETFGHDVNLLQYREGYLLGGCTNGQVLLWNVKCELTPLHDLTGNDYYQFVSHLFHWPADLVNLKIVRPVAISPLDYSHVEEIGAISWTDKPVFGRFPPGTLQFFTVGLEGVLKFWNIPLCKLKVLVQRSKLTSKWNRIRKHFVILSKAGRKMFQLKPYFERKLESLASSVLLLKTDNDSIVFAMGTFFGDLLLWKWEVNQFKQLAHYRGQHDGPVWSLQQHPQSNNMLLCVGGRVFSIWEVDNGLNMVTSRKCQLVGVRYTDAQWHLAGALCLSRSDGSLEFWDFVSQSHKPISELSITSEQIIQIKMNFSLNQKHIWLCDATGCLYLTHIVNYVSSLEYDKYIQMFTHCAHVHCSWMQWTDTRMRRERAAELKLLEDEKLAQLMKFRRSQQRPKSMSKVLVAKPPPLTLVQLETQYAIDTVLNQKNFQLDQERQLQVPIKQVKAEERKLKLKRSRILERGDAIFQANVTTRFPHLSTEPANLNEQTRPTTAAPRLFPEQNNSISLDHRTNMEKEAERKRYVDDYESMQAELSAFIVRNRCVLHEHQRFNLLSALGETRREIWTRRREMKSKQTNKIV